jgi:hypothetical protein
MGDLITQNTISKEMNLSKDNLIFKQSDGKDRNRMF